MSQSTEKGNYQKMYNPYLYEKLTQTHHQELLQEAEQQSMLSQLPRHHPQLMQLIARRCAAFFMSLPFSTKKVEQSAKMVTGQL
jgi:hypothetical protein